MTDPAPLPPPLAQFAGKPVPAPDWFADALAAPFETGAVERDGVRLVLKAWGKRGDPALVLIHGGTAHKGWWDALGPFLAAPGRRVIAPDLAGMGQSGWREVYTMTDHAADMRAAAEDAGALGRQAYFRGPFLRRVRDAAGRYGVWRGPARGGDPGQPDPQTGKAARRFAAAPGRASLY